MSALAGPLAADPPAAARPRGLSAAAVLDLAERGLAADATERALLVLAEATGAPRGQLAELAVARDALLFATRRLCFGDELRAVVSCPACDERLEFTAPGSSFAPEDGTGAGATAGNGDGDGDGPGDGVVALSADVGRRALRAALRPPTSADLAALRGSPSVAAARDALFARCLLWVERDGAPVDAAALAADELEALAGASRDEPALADVVLELTCPACAATWASVFDIATFLWEELAAFADRLLPEVHVIARAYGWGEGEILALSPARRARYLELIEAAG